MYHNNIKFMTTTAIIAALYTAISLAIPLLQFSQIQVRFAEILCLLPILSKRSIWGIALGCFITNLVGAFLGINPLGYYDAIIGTLATIFACLLTFKFRNIKFHKLPLLSALMPVLINAIFIGLELAYCFMPDNLIYGWIINGIFVGIGELIACVFIGLPVFNLLSKNKKFCKLINF